VSSVKVNLAKPAEIPVTTPKFVTVATAILSLAQVPPVVGDSWVTSPIQIPVGPVTATVGVGFTVTAAVGSDGHSDAELVNIKVAVPGETPVTTPPLFTEAIPASDDDQVPPVVGSRVVVVPTQIKLSPVIVTIGLGNTCTYKVSEKQPVLDWNTNLALPASKPVTVLVGAPVIFTVSGEWLVHVVPTVKAGLMVVDDPTQMVSLAAETVGLGLTSMALV